MILHQVLDPSSRKELESIMNLAVENTFSLMMQLMRKYDEPLEITREYIRKEQVLEQHLILLLHGFIEIKNHVNPETYHKCVRHCHELLETRMSSLHNERKGVQEEKRTLSGWKSAASHPQGGYRLRNRDFLYDLWSYRGQSMDFKG